MATPHPLRYFLDIGGSSHQLREIEGVERISKRFHLAMSFYAEAPLDPDGLVKSEVAIVLRREGAEQRRITGIVVDLTSSAILPMGTSTTFSSEIFVVVEPRLTLASYRSDIRVFRNKTAPQIIAEVYDGLGIKHDQRLSASYQVRPYCVQLRETDLDFTARLMEEEGIFLYSSEDDTVVQGDGIGAYDSIGELPFRGGSGMDQDEDAIWAFGRRSTMSVGKVTLRDWNEETPSLDMDVSAAGPTQSGPEFYDYPGEYRVPSHGQHIANMIAAGYDCASRALRGKSFSGKIAPGRTFDLMGAPPGLSDGNYVVTEVRHSWHREKGGFEVAFEALPGELVFRPRLEHEGTTLTNPVTGFVTGPPGADDIYTDELGRVKVHFHWDRLQPRDGECSHWVPVMQDNTGHSVAIPRIGWEVLIHFLEGDPDRPVVMGRVYNTEDQFPNILPRDKTRTAIQSFVSPSRDGQNMVEWDDQAGGENFSIQAERDQNTRVANDREETVLVNRIEDIKRHETIEIGANQTFDVVHNVTENVQLDQSITVGGSRQIAISKSDSSAVEGNRNISIGSVHLRKFGNNDGVTTNVLLEQVGAVDLETSVGANDDNADRVLALTVGGAIIELAGADIAESAKERIETIGGLAVAISDESMRFRANTSRTTTVGMNIDVTAAEEIMLAGAKELTLESTTGEHVVDEVITFKVGETTIRMEEGLIKIVAAETIKLLVSEQNTQGADEAYQI